MLNDRSFLGRNMLNDVERWIPNLGPNFATPYLTGDIDRNTMGIMDPQRRATPSPPNPWGGWRDGGRDHIYVYCIIVYIVYYMMLYVYTHTFWFVVDICWCCCFSCEIINWGTARRHVWKPSDLGVTLNQVSTTQRPQDGDGLGWMTVDRLNRNGMVSDLKWPENDAHICTYGDYIGPKLGTIHYWSQHPFLLELESPSAPNHHLQWHLIKRGLLENQPWPFRWFSHWNLHRAMADFPAQVGKMGLLSVQFPKTLSRVLNTARQLNRRAAGPGAMHDWICPFWGVPKMEVPQKWMLYFMENPSHKRMIWG